MGMLGAQAGRVLEEALHTVAAPSVEEVRALQGQIEHLPSNLDHCCLDQGLIPMLRVALLSESDFTITGHGVHSAFLDNMRNLDSANDVLRISPWCLRRSDVLHVHSAGPIALALMAQHTGPRVVTAHVTHQSFVGSLSYADTLESCIKGYLRYFYSQADLIIAVSPAVCSELRTMGIKRPIKIIPNTIDCAYLHKIRRRRSAIRIKLGWEGKDVVLAVGQIQPRKGVLEFIKCAEQLPEASFVWVGSFLFGLLSAERDQLKRVICSAPPNVTFTGILPRQSVYEYCAASDIFFHPSRHETFGLAILEAAAAGLPIVLRDLPSYRTLFGNGYIATVDNFADVVRMLIKDHARRKDLGSKALEIAWAYDRRGHWDELKAAYAHATEIHDASVTIG